MQALILAAGIGYAAVVLGLTFGAWSASLRFRTAQAAARRAAGEVSHVPERVVVAAAVRNEEEHLPAFLAALEAQDYPTGRLEVVVADDASTDSTPDILRDFRPAKHGFRSIRIDDAPEGGSPKKAALSAAIAFSDAPFVLLTDGDTDPPPGWVSGMAAALSGGCIVVGGHSPPQTGTSLASHAAALWELGSAALAAGFIGLGVPLHIIGRNWGFHRQVYEAAGGYRGLESALSGDDTLMAQRLGSLSPSRWWGFTLAPAVQVPTRPTQGWRHLWRQLRRHTATGRRFRPTPFLIAASGLAVFALILLSLIRIVMGDATGAHVAAVALKLGSDTLFLTFAASAAARVACIPIAPLFSLLHLIFFPILQLLGLFMPFRWKGRTGR